MQVIHKTTFQSSSGQFNRFGGIGPGAIPLDLQQQGNHLSLWYLREHPDGDLGAPADAVGRKIWAQRQELIAESGIEIYALGTGQRASIELKLPWRYLKTLQFFGGELVLHFFWRNF